MKELLIGGGIVIERALSPEEIAALQGSLADAKAARLAELADIRWRKTQTFGYDGEDDVPADSALSVITSLAVADQMAQAADPDYDAEAVRTFKLKSPGVFRQWTIGQIITYGLAIGAYVQACFDREASLASAISGAADHAALAAVDLTAGWPA